MRQMRKGWSTIGLAARLEASITTVDGTEQWAKLSCPLSAEDFCGEYCAWYNEETVGGTLGIRSGVLVNCKGKTIGELFAGVQEPVVEQDTVRDHDIAVERDVLKERVADLEAMVERLREKVGAHTADEERAAIVHLLQLEQQKCADDFERHSALAKMFRLIVDGKHWPTGGVDHG